MYVCNIKRVTTLYICRLFAVGRQMGSDIWNTLCNEPCAYAQAPRYYRQYFSEFRIALNACKNTSKCRAFLPLDYKITEDLIIQPDVLIVCDDIKKKFLDFAPALVVEVLSPSTAMKDRHTKFKIYQQQQIPYYLLVSPDEEIVEVYELENNVYVLRQKEHAFTFNFQLEGCEATIDFAEIW